MKWSLLIFFESGGHLFRSIKSSHILLEILFLQDDFFVSFQYENNRNFALNQRQVLSDAISFASTKGEKTILLSLSGITLTPSFRIELKRILVKLVSEVVRFDFDCNQCSFFDRNISNIVVFYCLSGNDSSIWAIHSQSFLHNIIEIGQLFKIVISNISYY